MLKLLALTGLLFSFTSQATLINGDFEDTLYNEKNHRFVDPADIVGWDTLSGDVIEVWSNTAHGVKSFKNERHVELNAHKPDTLFQDVFGIDAGLEVGFHFAHRGRSGVDTMNLSIIDLGLDGLFNTDDDTSLFSEDYETGTQWVYYTNEGKDPIFTLGNTIRFAYSAVASANNDKSYGNFLDDVGFGVGVGARNAEEVPEPASIAFMSLGLLLLARLRTKKSAIA